MSNSTVSVRPLPEATTTTTDVATRTLIIIQGIATVGLTMLFLPAGVAAVLVNAVLAFASRGVKRKLFAGFAIAGAIVALVIGLGLMAAFGSGTTEVNHLP